MMPRLLALAVLTLGSGVAAQRPPDPFGNRTINVCTSGEPKRASRCSCHCSSSATGTPLTLPNTSADYAPIVSCADRDPELFTGFDIAVFRRIQTAMGWADARLNWTW